MTDLGVTRIGRRTFRWGERTFVMGILNVTPDSFSGDGLLAASPEAMRSPRPSNRREPWRTKAPTCSMSAASRRARVTPA